MYKLLIVKNRYTKKLNFSVGLDWFKKNTPIQMSIEEISTDFDVTTEKISNATYKGVICGDDIYPKLRTVIPEGKYHAVIFVYGNKLDGIRVNVAKQLPLYPGTDLIQLCQVTDKGKSLNHELFHTFFHRLQRQQIMIEDPMDSVVVDGILKHYFNNENLNSKHSNRTIALDRLKPYWDKVLNILVLNTQTPQPTQYKYFKESEVVGLKTKLVEMLDKAREIAGIPFVINSGYRTLAHNAEVGGTEDSSHTKGLAVDLRARNSTEHFLITKGLIIAGFTRISKKYPSHIHCDIDDEKTQNVLF